MPSTMRAASRAVAAVIAATALLLTGCLLLAPQASAHDALVSTDPAQDSSVAKTPPMVRLTFDKPALALGTQIRVTGPDGALVSAGSPRLVDSDVTQDLAGELAAGTYAVTWRVTSADGHPVTGRFGFTTQAAGKGALAASAVPASTAGPATEQAGTDSSTPVLWLLVAAVVILLAVGAVATVRIRRSGPGPWRPRA